MEIKLEHVWKTYVVGGEEVHALRDVDLTISQGEYVAVMGPSGSGKSTLLHILGCLDRPTKGKHLVDGLDMGTAPESLRDEIRRWKIGFVFQFFHLLPRLTALGNVELPMMLAGVAPAERRRRAMEALEAVGLKDRVRHRPDELSGGQRQRVAIARAVVMRPEVILADEPTGNLDQAASAEVMELLESLNSSGITLVVVTHDPEVGDRAHRRVRLSGGEVVEDAVEAG